MMALRVTTEEQAYYDAVVRPLVQSIKNLAKFVGEVSGEEKDELIGRAGVVIFPSPWEEPFGLVLAEAAARGTPVVALARGSAPELVVEGVTGMLCIDEEAMARAIPEAMKLDPAACRAHAMAHFDRDKIARQHVTLYEALCSGHAESQRRPYPCKRISLRVCGCCRALAPSLPRFSEKIARDLSVIRKPSNANCISVVEKLA